MTDMELNSTLISTMNVLNLGFNLTEMPDKFKPEWRDNSDWLRLSFHANANLPDRPYIRASYSQAKFEHDRIMNEILRFAGEEAFAGPVTTIHWGDANPRNSSCIAFKRCQPSLDHSGIMIQTIYQYVTI